MKTTRLLVISSALFLGACSSVSPSSSPSTAQVVTATTELIAKQVVSLALENNPKYIPVAQAVLAGIDGVFLVDAGVTPESALAFADSVSLRYPMSDRSKAVLASALTDLYNFYVQTYKPTVVARLDPNAAHVLQSFRVALMTALARTFPNGNPQ